MCFAAGPGSAFGGLAWLILSRKILLIFVPFGAIPIVLGMGIGLIWALFLLAVGIGLLKVQDWARVLLIVVIGFLLLQGITHLLIPVGAAALMYRILSLLEIGVFVWTLKYLFRPDVKQAFGATGL